MKINSRWINQDERVEQGGTLKPAHIVFLYKVVLSIGLGNDLEALTLTWDGNSTVSASVHGKYFQGTSGLCGTWDDDNDNDQTGKDGQVDKDLDQFGWSWKKVEGGTLQLSMPCGIHYWTIKSSDILPN